MKITVQLGHPDVLVYNVYEFGSNSPMIAVAAEKLVEALRVNVVGALVATQQVAPHVRISIIVIYMEIDGK